MVQTTSGYADVNGGKLYYEASGAGKPLVLGHAGPCDRRQWDGQWEAFAQDYRVIRYDMRGYGKSDPIREPVERRDDLAGLLDALDIEQAALLGCSMGGTTALDFTLDHPDRVSALIVFSATPSGFAFQGEMPPLLVELTAAAQAGDVERALELHNRIVVDGPFRRPDQVAVGIRAHVAEMNRRPTAEATYFRNDMQPLRPLNPPAAQRLGEIKAPTLIIAGALDDPEIVRAADVLASGIPGAQKYILPDGAHLANLEHPDEFNRVVLDFLHRLNW